MAWLIKEFTLNHIQDPYILQGIFINQSILGFLGIGEQVKLEMQSMAGEVWLFP